MDDFYKTLPGQIDRLLVSLQLEGTLTVDVVGVDDEPVDMVLVDDNVSTRFIRTRSTLAGPDTAIEKDVVTLGLYVVKIKIYVVPA